MGFSSGTFTFTTSGLPVVTGTAISSTVKNTQDDEIEAGLTACLLKDGTQTVTANIPMATFIFTGLGAGTANGHSLRYEQLFTTSAVTLLGAMDWVTGANIASAATINLTTATGNAAHVTGTTTITAVTLGTGMWRLVIFDGALTLTHHATNNHLPGAANITTAANDRALYWSDGTTVYCVSYIRSASLAATQTGTETLTNKTLTAPALNGALSGDAIAAQAEMETATATDSIVSPGRMVFHPGVAKAWGYASADGATILASNNISSLTDNATGDYTWNFTTAFSSANYAAGIAGQDASANVKLHSVNQDSANAPGTGAYRVVAGNVNDVASRAQVDIRHSVIFMGDQ